jgi:hypothetical protein
MWDRTLKNQSGQKQQQEEKEEEGEEEEGSGRREQTQVGLIESRDPASFIYSK